MGWARIDRNDRRLKLRADRVGTPEGGSWRVWRREGRLGGSWNLAGGAE